MRRVPFGMVHPRVLDADGGEPTFSYTHLTKSGYIIAVLEQSGRRRLSPCLHCLHRERTLSWAELVEAILPATGSGTRLVVTHLIIIGLSDLVRVCHAEAKHDTRKIP